MKSKEFDELSVEKIHEKIHAAGFQSVSKWAIDCKFNPKLVQKVIERWVKNKEQKTRIPSGDTFKILCALKKLLNTPDQSNNPPVQSIQITSDWLNFKEAVEYLRVNREKTLRNWVAKGVIPHVKEPSTGCLRFNKKALDSWLLRGER